MLVISRQPGESIVIASNADECVIILCKIRAQTATVVIRNAIAAVPGLPITRTAELQVDVTYKIADNITLTLLHIAGEKARLAINAPVEMPVHRFEVYQAIRQTNRDAALHRPDDPDPPGDIGIAGSPVPRPSSPKPPTLNVRLDEPKSPDEADD